LGEQVLLPTVPPDEVHTLGSVIVHAPRVPQHAAGCGQVFGEHVEPRTPALPGQLAMLVMVHDPVAAQHATSHRAGPHAVPSPAYRPPLAAEGHCEAHTTLHALR
jgi:hypothetical protein